jgi:hypothetical protein
MLWHRPFRSTILFLLTMPLTAHAFDTSRIADPEVKACVERALPSKTARQIQKLEAVGNDGFVRETVREMWWMRSDTNDSRVLLRTLEPFNDRGVSVLVNDDASRDKVSYTSYSPEFKRTRRVSGESVFGTIITSDFTYDDFSYFYRRDDREQVERRDNAVVDDVPVYILETSKPRDNASYSLVRFFIDQEKCVPVRTEFLAPNGELRKEQVVDREQILQVGDRWVPHLVTMTDHKLNTHSIYTIQEIDIDPELDNSMFERTALLRGAN